MGRAAREIRPGYLSACVVVHTCALALWLGSVLTAGATAAIVFPTMRRLDPWLARYEGFDGEHWKLAAGQVQQRVFGLVDAVQVVCAAGAIVSLLVLWCARDELARSRRTPTVCGAASLGIAVGVLAFHTLVLGPRMQANLREYWSQAEAGMNFEAKAAQLAFETDHPSASRTLSVTAGAVGVSLVVWVWTLARQRRECRA